MSAQLSSPRCPRPAREIRMWCDLLGWMWRDVPVASPPVAQVWACGDRFKIGFRDGREYAVDLPTLAICTLVRHAGPVDVGPCPECGGVKRVTVTNVGTWHAQGHLAAEESACPACVANSNPTGREVIDARRAVLMAAPRRALWAGNGRIGDDAKDFIRGRAHRQGATIAGEWEWVHAEGGQVQVWVDLPGHEGAREALRALAEGWRRLDNACPRPPKCSAEFALAVWGDYLEADGRTVSGLRSFAECHELCAWLLIGLNAQAAYAHLTAAWERETVACGSCGGSGRWKPRSRGWAVAGVIPCERCAGLGRVRPESQQEAACA